ncbi:helix-turn-helix domain-containing protein [Priestia megaterium]|uniref:HNH endonuclease n=1 Tax=Priestia megaterium TaxID=1404 RepID=UPI00234EF003|nr:HNH endonuclease [Priestia megaterium]MDC7724274.1 helix-turn-helix domain-containing protein [Priestia megaterium]
MGKTKYKKPSREELKSLFIDKDMSKPEISEKLNVPLRTIKRWLSEYEIKKGNQRYNPPNKEKLEEEYSQATMQELAQMYTVSRATIKSWLQNAGIPIRQGIHNKKRPSKQELEKYFLIQKLSYKEIGEVYKVKPRTVASWIGFYFSKEEKEVRYTHKSSGYVMIYKPRHSNANKKGFVLEHRYVVSKYINRKISSFEEVHHIDMDKSNNNINNLILFPSKKDHSRFHRYMSKVGIYLLKISKERPEAIQFDKEVLFKGKWLKKIDLLLWS